MVTVNSLTLIGSFASSLVLQIFDHNKQRTPSHFSFKACKLHLFDSELKKECWVQLKPSVEQSSKVCREDTIFYLFFPYFLCHLPNVNCKTVTLFLRIQVRPANSKKKGLEP